MRTTCLLALSSLWLLALASAAPKKLEKKSIANTLAQQAIEPVEQKLDAPSPKISDEALMESPGETVDRAKKQASTTFCVEVRQNKPTYVDCNEANGANRVIVVQGNEPCGPDGSGTSGGLPGPTGPLIPGGLLVPGGPHSLHLPHGLLGPHHGSNFPGPGADGSPATIHYLIPGGDGGGHGPNVAPNNLPGMGGEPSGGPNGILYQLPGGFPGDSGLNGAGPNGVHVHVHPTGGFPSGSGGPSGPSPTGVHFHLPAGNAGGPSGTSSSLPIHLSGIECLCAGTPVAGKDAEGNDGTPSDEALAVKFLQDLQNNDRSVVDSQKAANGDQSPSDQPSSLPTIVIPKLTGMPYALPMMIGGVPMMRTYSPYGWPNGISGGDSPMRTISISTPNLPSPTGGAPLMGGMIPMMRTTGGSPMMGGMPLMPGPMMGPMPMMSGPIMGGPMMGGMPMMAKSSEEPKTVLPIMIHMPTAKSGEDPKNPTTTNGSPLTITNMPMGKVAETPTVPTSPANGLPVAVINMQMGPTGENPTIPTPSNGSPLTIMSMPMGRSDENPVIPSLPNGLSIMALPKMKTGDQFPDGTNSPTGGKIDPSMMLRYYPVRPMPYPVHNPAVYPTFNPQLIYPAHPMPGGYVAPYQHYGLGHPHRSQYDCLQDSFQSVPAMQGLRFSRGPDESELPPVGQQTDAEAKSESPAGSEHAESARGDDKETRISHFIAEEHDAANSV